MNHSAAKIGLLVDDDTLYLRTLQRSLGRRGVAPPMQSAH